MSLSWSKPGGPDRWLRCRLIAARGEMQSAARLPGTRAANGPCNVSVQAPCVPAYIPGRSMFLDVDHTAFLSISGTPTTAWPGIRPHAALTLCLLAVVAGCGAGTPSGSRSLDDQAPEPL